MWVVVGRRNCCWFVRPSERFKSCPLWTLWTLLLVLCAIHAYTVPPLGPKGTLQLSHSCVLSLSPKYLILHHERDLSVIFECIVNVLCT